MIAKERQNIREMLNKAYDTATAEDKSRILELIEAVEKEPIDGESAHMKLFKMINDGGQNASNKM